MTDVMQTLYAFWSAFYPAYVGRIDGRAFPYITYDVEDLPPFQTAVMTAYGWFKRASGESVYATAAEFADDVKEAIPTEGKRLNLPQGFLILRPNDAGFISLYEHPDTPDVVGVRISYEVTYYAR